MEWLEFLMADRQKVNIVYTERTITSFLVALYSPATGTLPRDFTIVLEYNFMWAYQFIAVVYCFNRFAISRVRRFQSAVRKKSSCDTVCNEASSSTTSIKKFVDQSIYDQNKF